MNENEKPTRQVAVTATLADKGEYIKFSLHKLQPAPAPGARYTYYDNPEYAWRKLVEGAIGRMHFEDIGSPLYPLVPGFESFGRAESIDTTPGVVTTTRYEYEEVKLTEEEIVKKMLKSLRLEDEVMKSAKITLRRAFEAELYDGDEIVSEGQDASLDKAVNDIFADLNNNLLGAVKYRARQVKLARKHRKAVDTREEVPHLLFTFKNGLRIHMDGDCAKIFSILLPSIERIRGRLNLLRVIRNSKVENGDFDYEPKGELIPFEHQKVMYRIHMLLDKSANLSQMGTGKSLAVLMTADKRIEKGEVRKGHILIICPATILDTWVNKHIRKGTPHLSTKIISGSYAERLEMIMEKDCADIYLTNFETFSMKSKMEIAGKEYEVPLAPLFNMKQWDMVIIDEAHKIKNPDAKRTQQIIATFKEVPYAIIMSGTINANKLYDLHSPFVFLNHAKQFNSLHFERGEGKPYELSKMHEQFVTAYFDGGGWKKNPKPFTINELRERMEEISVRFEKKECFELPEKLYQQVMIEMDEKQKLLYMALKNFLAAQLADLIDSGGTVTIMNILAMMVKLAEAANGWIYDDNKELITLPKNPKLEALMEIVDDLNEDDKVVVWSRFTQDLHTIYDALVTEYGREAVAIIHGGEHCPKCGSRKTERYEITERFNTLTDPLRFVVVNQATGSHGIDLIGATYEIFFSNSFVKTDRTQAEDRCHRHGMRDNLTIIDLVMKETVDVDVLMALKSWKSVTAALLGHFGINPEKLFGRGGGEGEEAPVVVEHIMQRPGECALSTIAMLAGAENELVRAWMTVALKDSKKYKGEPVHILLAVEHFIPQMKAQWEAYMGKQEEAKVSLEVLEIPKAGTGACIIRHEKSARISHAVAYSNGFVYDPGRMGRVEWQKYADWIVSSRYYVEWVFPLQSGMNIDFSKFGEEQK